MDQWERAHLVGAKLHVTSCGVNNQNKGNMENTVKCERGPWAYPQTLIFTDPGPTMQFSGVYPKATTTTKN